jgi:hypothetical protein
MLFLEATQMALGTDDQILSLILEFVGALQFESDTAQMTGTVDGQ